VNTEAARTPRADAQRNRERLMEAAKAAFADAGADVALEEIARRAGVGIGTFYRHFPTRDAIIEAVYRREVEQLGAAAQRLLADEPPGQALRDWMRVFVDYIATKKVIAAALAGLSSSPTLYAASGETIISAITTLTTSAIAAGDIRPDADPADLLRALMGFTYGATAPGWRESALRLIDLLMAGLRSPHL
jgi:AcrR family transcriptional regulator